MKKILLLSLTLVLLGAGCTGIGNLSKSSVEGPWTIAFDLPENWVMVPPYQETGTPISLTAKIDKLDTEVVVQSTKKHILTNGSLIDEDSSVLFEAVETVSEDFTKISVLKFSPERLVPSEAEDLGKGFYKEEICESGGECESGDASRFVYYYKTEEATYKFTVKQNGQDESAYEKVILSAKEVKETE